MVIQKIAFSKDKSDVVAKVEGTFVPRDKPQDDWQQKFEEKFVLRPKRLESEQRAER